MTVRTNKEREERLRKVRMDVDDLVRSEDGPNDSVKWTILNAAALIAFILASAFVPWDRVMAWLRGVL